MESWFKCVLKLEFRIPATATYKSRDTFEGRDFCKGFKDRVEFCLAESGGDYALECLERDERKQLNICYAGDLLKAKISFRPHEGTGDLMAEETRCEEVRQQAWQEVLAYLFPVLKEYDVQAILTGFSVCRETCIQVSAGVPEEYPQEQKDEAKQWKVGLNAS
ncbi:MAG: hypothetical protein LBQ54_05605 [Planctomycetaceae bacterium]|nr:hypothetical protein [Planctomycetaceae bacterium]